VTNQGWMSQAFLLEAMARDALGDPAAAGRALEQALDLVEPDGAVFAFLLHPAPELFRCHARRGTAHSALVAEILGLLAGNKPAPPRGEPDRLPEPLSGSEARILRFLPTNLSAPEIAGQLSVSVNTVRTHMRHVYEKLGAHSRTEAVEQARSLGMLAPSSRTALAMRYSARLMLAKENRQSTASSIESASTAGKSPMSAEAVPTPMTGMIRPV
jgi:LuxR family maltose regulon positive regulatory protein